MPKPYSKLLLTTILLTTLLTSAAAVDWPVDGGDSQRRWYKPTYYDINGNENASTYNLGCTINRFYIHDSTIYAECTDTIHKIQLTHPNLTYQGNLTITGDMLGILQGKIIALALYNILQAYNPDGTTAWTAGNLTYYKWNNTDYVPTVYSPKNAHPYYGGGWVTENHAYVQDSHDSGAILRAYDPSGKGVGLFTCGKAGFSGGTWRNIAEDGDYITAKCYAKWPQGGNSWNTIATYNIKHTLYDNGYNCHNLIRGATNQSLISCSPEKNHYRAYDPNLMLSSTHKYQFYGTWNTYTYYWTFTSDEPDTRNYLNYNETIDNNTNYGSRACYDETNWYEITGVNLTRWTIPRTNPIWTVTVNPYPYSGNPICLENVVLVTNSSGAALAIDKQTGTTQTAINMYTANQILIDGANTVITTSGTKIYYTSPRTTTILKPDLTIKEKTIKWQTI